MKSDLSMHFSQDSDEWATPAWLFQLLDREFKFEVDVCATVESAKCRRFFSIAEDGLKRRWQGTCFMNPPYSEYGFWIEKALRSSREDATVVCLIPARTDTSYWHDFVTKAKEIRFLRGRLSFNDFGTAPFPSAVVVFSPSEDGEGGPVVRFVDPAAEWRAISVIKAEKPRKVSKICL